MKLFWVVCETEIYTAKNSYGVIFSQFWDFFEELWFLIMSNINCERFSNQNSTHNGGYYMISEGMLLKIP